MPSFETALWITLFMFCMGSWVLMSGWQRWWRQRQARREIARTARFRNRLHVADRRRIHLNDDLERAQLNAVVGQRRTQ